MIGDQISPPLPGSIVHFPAGPPFPMRWSPLDPHGMVVCWAWTRGLHDDQAASLPCDACFEQRSPRLGAIAGVVVFRLDNGLSRYLSLHVVRHSGEILLDSELQHASNASPPR